ncbi:MAG: tetratricopeptide repeat protein [Planctomycetota bacterium]
MPRSRWGRLVAAWSAGLLLIGGCAGHGRYTQEAVDAATTRMDSLRAENERGLAEQAFLAGKLERAAGRLKDALAYAPDSAGCHLLLARVRLEQNRLREAIGSVDRVLALEPRNEEALYVAGMISERAGDGERALASFLRAAELDPEDAHAVLAAAEVMADIRGPDAAAAYLSAWPGAAYDPGAAQTLAQLHLLAGDAGEAVQRLEDARLLAPDDMSILEDLAAALMAEGRHVDAEPVLAAARRSPGSLTRRDLKRQHAVCLREAGDLVSARDLFLELARETGNGPDGAAAWASVGELSHRIGDGPRVRESASRLVGISPEGPEGYVLWALWHWSRGDYGAARRSIDTGMTRARGDRDLERLSVALSRLEERDAGGLTDAAGRAVLTGAHDDVQ